MEPIFRNRSAALTRPTATRILLRRVGRIRARGRHTRTALLDERFTAELEVPGAVDETTARHRGAQVCGNGGHRDAVRSRIVPRRLSRKKGKSRAYCLSHNLWHRVPACAFTGKMPLPHWVAG